MIVSALGLVSPLSQGPAASKKFKDILPLLLGKYKCIRFYSPWGELPKNQAWDSCSGSPEQKAIRGPSTGSTQERLRATRCGTLTCGTCPPLWARISNSHQPSNMGTIILGIKKLELREVNELVQSHRYSMAGMV